MTQTSAPPWRTCGWLPRIRINSRTRSSNGPGAWCESGRKGSQSSALTTNNRPASRLSSSEGTFFTGMRRSHLLLAITLATAFLAAAADDTSTKGAAVVGVAFGAITIESTSLGVDSARSYSPIGSRSARMRRRHGETARLRTPIPTPRSCFSGTPFFGQTKGAFAGFGLDGVTLKPDDSSNKALSGRSISNGEIVAGAEMPAAAQSLISMLNGELDSKAN